MNRSRSYIAARVLALAGFVLATQVLAAPKKKKGPERAEQATTASPSRAVLWRHPADIRSRDLFYGPGGPRHVPPARVVFVREDFAGTNPKLVVRDASGVQWTLKLGAEARPEIAATRIVWAVGYFANEDYFLRRVRVEDLPARLRRGQKYVRPGGVVVNARMKRHLKGEKKLGYWHWRQNPFTGTRELGGLRVMMALINSWDLKDDNNAIYQEKDGAKGHAAPRVYMVKDLGSSFGTTGQSWTDAMTKGNLKSYRRSKFITKETPGYIDFDVPTRPALNYLFVLPMYITDLRSHWIGRHIPRADVRWIAQLLARLSPRQISDAFRAAGYSPAQVRGFSRVVEQRIAVLTKM
ncbi:MAG: hypothetical protein ACRD3D_02865 [Terriglobia bacterium]